MIGVSLPLSQVNIYSLFQIGHFLGGLTAGSGDGSGVVSHCQILVIDCGMAWQCETVVAAVVMEIL